MNFFHKKERNPWIFGIILLLISSILYSKSDSEIKKQIIKESIANYPGVCACPYQLTSSGRKCGRRSAYNKSGGYRPICYETDITKEMLLKYE